MRFTILNKVFGSGTPPSGNKFAFLARLREIDYFPEPDSLGVVLLGDIKMKENCGMMQLYITPSSQEYGYEISGDADSKGFKVKFTGTHPGTEQQALEFATNYLEEEFVILIPDCKKGVRVLGTPDVPLIFTSTHKSTKDTQKFNFVFEQEVATDFIYHLYDGIITLNENIDIDMNDFLEALKNYIKIDGSNLSETQKQNLKSILGVENTNIAENDLSLTENRSFNLKNYFLNFFSNSGKAKVGINKNNPDKALDVVGGANIDALILGQNNEPNALSREGNILYINTPTGKRKLVQDGDFVMDDHGIIQPDTSVPVDGWAKGWYTPGTSSVDPGTNYPNQDNLKAIDGKLCKFYFNNTTWQKVEVELPSNAAEKVFNPLDDEKASTMKAGADWVLENKKEDGFVFQQIPFHVHPSVPSYRVTDKIPVVVGDVINVQCWGISGEKLLALWDENQNLVGNFITAVGGVKSNENFTVPSKGFVSVQSSSPIGISAGLRIKVYSPIYLPPNGVDVFNKVLNGFVGKQLVWEELIMPLPNEKDNALLDINYSQYGTNGWANGAFSIASLGADAVKIKVSGMQGGGSSVLWLGGFNETTDLYDRNIKGAQTTDVILDIDRSKYEAYVYSRIKGTTKIFIGKFVDVVPTEGSVMNFILQNSGGGGGGNAATIDAYSEHGVSPEKSASENTIALNNAIQDAFAKGRKLIVPSGLIMHNGINYKEGVRIIGAGYLNTILKSANSNSVFKDLDSTASNIFRGGYIKDMTIDGDNLSNFGLELSNNQGFSVRDVIFKKFKSHAVKFQGQLQHYMDNCYVSDCENGLLILTAQNTSYGPMQSNLIHYHNVYFAGINKLCADIDTASLVKFSSCNFESCGIANDNNTGGVRAVNLSPSNEGLDLIFDFCWSEGVRGVFLNISASRGNTVIHNTMVHKGGNGNGGSTSPGILNNGCKVLLSGGTDVKGFQTSVVTNGGQTRLDGLSVVESHAESNGGIFKTAIYS